MFNIYVPCVENSLLIYLYLYIMFINKNILRKVNFFSIMQERVKIFKDVQIFIRYERLMSLSIEGNWFNSEVLYFHNNEAKIGNLRRRRCCIFRCLFARVFKKKLIPSLQISYFQNGTCKTGGLRHEEIRNNRTNLMP